MEVLYCMPKLRFPIETWAKLCNSRGVLITSETLVLRVSKLMFIKQKYRAGWIVH